MKTYARIDGGTVAELFETDGDIAKLFHPDLVWIEAAAGVAVGDEYNGGVFQRPAPIVAPGPDPKIAIQAQIDQLERDSMTNRGARELQLAIMRQQGAANGLQTDEAIASKVIYFAKLLALDTQIRALRAQL